MLKTDECVNLWIDSNEEYLWDVGYVVDAIPYNGPKSGQRVVVLLKCVRKKQSNGIKREILLRHNNHNNIVKLFRHYGDKQRGKDRFVGSESFCHVKEKSLT